MDDIPTRNGRPVEDPRPADPDDADRAKDRNDRQYVTPAKMVWIGLGLFLCGLLIGLVFGLGYVFADSRTMTLKEFLRHNLVPVLVSLAFAIFGLATTAAGLVNREGTD